MEETTPSTIVDMRNITKRFGRVVALDGVDFELQEGEIHALTGDNGSGKSTLIKTLVGLHKPDEGEVFIRGNKTEIDNPQHARRLGIATVYQDLALVDTMSVAANMFLGRAPVRKRFGLFPKVDWKQMNERSQEILRTRLNLDMDPTSDVEFLSGGERQAIAVARALVTDPDVVIMDEPTAALSADSAQRVRDLIQSLNDEGITILVISHSIDEIFELTDRVTVLETGNLVGTVSTSDVTEDDIVEMIVSGKMPARSRDGEANITQAPSPNDEGDQGVEV
jgi:ABC-type sugar transport system ATPase subunit